MKKRHKFIINLLYSLRQKGKRLPKFLRDPAFSYVKRVFEEEAIDAYFSDDQDIGFFESFIIGSDETKKLSNETKHTINVLKKTKIIEQLTGFVRHDESDREEQEVVKDNISSKKEKVAQLLIKKGEIIKYLGRRIVSRDESLYQKLESLFQNLNPDEEKSS